MEVLILYVIYITKVQMNIYAFEIQWNKLVICFGAVYFTIFIAIWNAKRKMNRRNIIEEIKSTTS